MTISLVSAQLINTNGGAFSSINVSAGDLVVVAVIVGGSFSSAGPSDNLSDTYTAATQKSAATLFGQMWYTTCSSAKTGFIVTAPSGASFSWGLAVYHTTTGTWSFDTTTGAQFAGTASGTTVSLPSITTPGAGVITCYADGQSLQVETLTTTSPFTGEASRTGSGGSTAAFVFDSISASAQTSTATCNCSATDKYGVYGLSFYVSSAATNTAIIAWTT